MLQKDLVYKNKRLSYPGTKLISAWHEKWPQELIFMYLLQVIASSQNNLQSWHCIWLFLPKNYNLFLFSKRLNLKNITSVSKKSEQTIVQYHYILWFVQIFLKQTLSLIRFRKNNIWFLFFITHKLKYFGTRKTRNELFFKQNLKFEMILACC